MNSYHLVESKTPFNMNNDHIAYLLQQRILDEKYNYKSRFLWNMFKDTNDIREYFLPNKNRQYNLVNEY